MNSGKLPIFHHTTTVVFMLFMNKILAFSHGYHISNECGTVKGTQKYTVQGGKKI